MSAGTMPLHTCLVAAIPGGYEAVWGQYKAVGKTEEEATLALRAKLLIVPKSEEPCSANGTPVRNS